MKSLKRTLFALAFSGLMAPAAASAQVTNYGNIAGLTTFQDVNTGFVWLDLNNFFNQSPNQMLGTANAAGFTLANFAQVQQLWSGLPLNGGQWSSYAAVMGSAPNRSLMWGMYDAGSTNTQSTGYAFNTDLQWNQFVVAGNWSQTANAGRPEADLNLWAYQQVVTTTPEPASMVLLASGLVGIAIVRRRRRQD